MAPPDVGSPDFRVYATPHEWGPSTAFVEIGPGRYTGDHWQQGFVFVDEEAFAYAAGIVRRHFPAYNAYGVQDIERVVAERVAADWLTVAAQLQSCSEDEATVLLGLKEVGLRLAGCARSQGVSEMLKALASAVSRFCRTEGHVCILGL